MKLLKWLYEKRTGKEAPYYYNYSLFTILCKPIRKWFANVVAANCPFNCIRILIYRMCGFRIGKGTFIGMRCYMDDMCYNLISIGKNVTISYGVFFAAHGKKQGHNPITIEDNVYVGMRASFISKKESGLVVGENAIVGACTLVDKNVPANATAVGVPCRIIEAVEEND